MADPLYTELAATAVDLLRELGQPITLTREGGTGVYDPQTGTVHDAADLTYTVNGVALDYTARERDGTFIRVGDRRVYLDPSLPVDPRPGDRLALSDGTALTVVTSSPLSPAGVVLLHDVQARGV